MYTEEIFQSLSFPEEAKKKHASNIACIIDINVCATYKNLIYLMQDTI
jgi:hypothetical protein